MTEFKRKEEKEGGHKVQRCSSMYLEYPPVDQSLIKTELNAIPVFIVWRAESICYKGFSVTISTTLCAEGTQRY